MTEKRITTPLLGAVIGDIIGSVFEWDNIKTKDFNLFCENSDFTDDTVMSIAVADSLLNQKDYTLTMQDYGRRYPNRGYGGRFIGWINSANPQAYNSWGNGSAMRVSAVGCFYNSLAETLAEAEKSALPSHNHPEGIKGAQATAAAIFLARTGKNKEEIKTIIEDRFNYDLSRSIEEIRPVYSFNESCQGTVPESIIAFLESKDFEDAIRIAISIGGDSDTVACITGGIALAYYGDYPLEIEKLAWKLLPKEFQEIIKRFNEISLRKSE